MLKGAKQQAQSSARALGHSRFEAFQRLCIKARSLRLAQTSACAGLLPEQPWGPC
jgi:hypothetical protein